jgi:hypothetical protein
MACRGAIGFMPFVYLSNPLDGYYDNILATGNFSPRYAPPEKR